MVFQKIRFFGADKSTEFKSAIVHELKPINLGANELLYQTGDDATEIYFIHQGRVKLYVDLNDFINDENLLKSIQEMEKRRLEEERTRTGTNKGTKPSFRAII